MPIVNTTTTTQTLPVPPDEHQLFDFKEKCLFCAEDISAEFLINESKKKIGKRTEVFKIRDAHTKNGITLFLEDVILKTKRKSRDNYKKKCTSISHIAAARQKSFTSPLQVGLSAYLHSKFGSKSLVNLISGLGFCASYRKTEIFELSAVFIPETKRQGFLQFVADNADVNVHTLDGLGTFHSMGMIKCITHKADNANSRGIFRLTDVPSATAIGNFGHIPIEIFEKKTSRSELQTLTVESI